MTLKELIKGKKVRFKYYRDGALWYETDDAFEFAVPVADTGTGIFKAEDGAIQYMRWIRQHLAERAEWEKEREEQARNMDSDGIVRVRGVILQPCPEELCPGVSADVSEARADFNART